MNVGDLKKMLENYPEDMEILHTMYSDYSIVEEGDWSVIKAVPQYSAGYVMRSHPSMSDDNKEKEMEFLHLTGN